MVPPALSATTGDGRETLALRGGTDRTPSGPGFPAMPSSIEPAKAWVRPRISPEEGALDPPVTGIGHGAGTGR
ncbi:hypothetical protein DKM19_35475 [Streptosporangium sp. 'caverna']|nr:hypothetical protein DKM19_35475 [Streptosporangium sp. 'caverna']